MDPKMGPLQCSSLERKSSHPVIRDLLNQDSTPAWEKVQSKVPKVPQPTSTVPIPPKDEKTDAKDPGSNMGESPGNEKKKPPVPFVETPSEKPREAPENKREEPKREDPGKEKKTPPKKSPEKPKVPKVPQVPTETEKTEKEPQEGGKEQPREGGEGTQKEPKKRPKYASFDDEETANAMESLMG